jgi:hypothetical protein
VEAARRFAEDIGMNFVATRGWTVGAASTGLDDYPYPWGEGFPDRCHFLWLQAVVHHDGGVAPCCGTFWAEDDFQRLDIAPVNLEQASFGDVWNGPNFVEARELFHSRVGNEATQKLACYDCPETKDFEGWKEALTSGATEFERTSSNDSYNYFWSRQPADGPSLVRIRRR